MSWFGWLTKGKCDITLLDILTFFGELFAVSIIVLILWLNYDKFRRRK